MEQKLAFRLGDAVISEGPACISESRLRCRSLHKGPCAKRNSGVWIPGETTPSAGAPPACRAYPFALRGGPQTSLSSSSAGDGAATVGATSTCGACARFQATRQRAPQNRASRRVAWASAPHCWHLNLNQYQRCRISPMLALLILNPQLVCYTLVRLSVTGQAFGVTGYRSDPKGNPPGKG